MALLEARPYRPFKSSEEYLEAMKEDLAEWLSMLYPELMINAENFMDRLDTGVALCKHANYVRQAAEDYLARRQARNKSMTRSMTSGLAGPILALGNVHYLPAAKSGTFFARDNVSNFITWCRKSLKVIECLLFETDDLILRKNEKHVILCLLEVARRGAKFGMLAPMLVQMERQIDREIAADNKANGIGIGIGIGTGIGIGCDTQTCNGAEAGTQTDNAGNGTDTVSTATDIFDTDSENEDENDDGPMLMYGPQPQIVTNDLKSLDEMVRDLVEKCTCPSQFPMVRVSEGKYRIGDTKVLIFVRILRSHVMVRVGGGWDTLSHYLDKHDPCRCKAQHRSSVAARLIPRNTSQNNGIELHKAQVIFERSPPTARRVVSVFNSNQTTTTTMPSNTSTAVMPNSNNTLSPPSGSTGVAITTTTTSSPNATVKQRSRSPTPRRKFLQQPNGNDVVDNNNKSGNVASVLLTSPNAVQRRSMSPSPRRLIDMRKKQTSLDSYSNNSGPKSLPLVGSADLHTANHHVQFESNPTQITTVNAPGANGSTNGTSSSSSAEGTANISNKFENISDNGSEISDEGYRSLGVIQSNAQKRESLHSQASIEDAESNVRLDQTSSDSQLSPADDTNINKVPEIHDTEYTHTHNHTTYEHLVDAGPQSLPAVLSVPQSDVEYNNTNSNNKFEQSGIFITDDVITVTDTVAAVQPGSKAPASAANAGQKTSVSKIPRSPVTQRRRRSSIDTITCGSGSLQDLSTRTGLPVFSRKKPAYRSVRMPLSEATHHAHTTTTTPTPPPRHYHNHHAHGNGQGQGQGQGQTTAVRDMTNTWSGRTGVAPTLSAKKRPTINTDTFAAPPNTEASTPQHTNFERNGKIRSSQILYDSNGRRVRGCTSSLTTSPVKNHASSPLAQQLLEAANSSKNDAQILEKMKALLSRYAASNQAGNISRHSAGAGSTGGATAAAAAVAGNSKKTTPATVFEDFTTAWVHSNGNLERSNSCSPPTKTLSKRSSAASSCDSTHSRDTSIVVSPRRERGMSKIPAPVRQHTELY